MIIIVIMLILLLLLLLLLIIIIIQIMIMIYYCHIAYYTMFRLTTMYVTSGGCVPFLGFASDARRKCEHRPLLACAQNSDSEFSVR